MKNKKTRRIVIGVVLVVLVVFIVSKFYSYVDNYYRATDEAWTFINEPAEGVEVEYVDNTILFRPENPVAGFIFYPGGLVETEAYAPLMESLAEQGIFGVVVKMPYYLAMFDANGARGIQAKYPEITDWYIGGHSLGGAMACLYADRHQSEYEGLILLAAYSTKDLTDEPAVATISIRGSEDGVLNMEKYEECKANLPSDFEEVVIEGGCHGYFGDYGMQTGDGEPSISVQQQTSETVDAIVDFVEK
ncbi:MAG: alpha/beta hydrolase [Pseudobutyrivibrio sp.]|uniref:alpha/beta hydrolase n=1 Tax=Pseudobutyrivibrio sp. TaxID=2014367 RepID=UPI0025DE57C1|nr:alpha/beta hydrolase [Pseudobutyrivibrio sp.]MBQ8490560.1 alpha/beta hydrolase [Pseudobutyrivibrio sp.]